jgi:hypothetical protein
VLLGLASLCAIVGVFPGTSLQLIGPALSELVGADQTPAEWLAPIGQLQIVFLLFIVFVAVIYIVKVWLQGRTVVRLDDTWACGYAAITPHMQYTASGFAAELVQLGRPMLSLIVRWAPLQRVLPVASTFHSHCQDRMETGWLFLNRGIDRMLGALRWIQSGNIRHYVLYVFAAVVFYLLCALVW